MSREPVIVKKWLAAIAVALIGGLFGCGSAAASGFTVTVNPGSSWCVPQPNGAFIVSNNDPPYFSFRCLSAFVLRGDPLGYAPGGAYVSAQINAPPGITITGATSVGSVFNLNNGTGWVGGSSFAGGGSAWNAFTTIFSDPPFASSYWGFAVECAPGYACSGAGQISLRSITLSASESQGPRLSAQGSGNLWYQTRPGEWIWNAPGDPWPLTIAASDPSGVCTMSAAIAQHVLPGPSSIPNTSQWQQCPNATWTPSGGASVDTRDYVPSVGTLPVTISATNAAHLPTSYSETLHVDNRPVSVSLSTPNDPNTGVWVNHAVTVDASAQTGPSGLGSLRCSVDGGPATGYSSGGETIDGTGVHTAACTATNRAVDPQGNPNSDTSAMSIKIDETPPAVGFAPADPADPTRLVANASDGQSGVAGGAIMMRPVNGGSWQALPTQTAGGRLVASFSDAGRSGPYVFHATACDAVGNCASTDEEMALPVRLAASSLVSFQRISEPMAARPTGRRSGGDRQWKAGGHAKLSGFVFARQKQAVNAVEYVKRCAGKQWRAGTAGWTVRRTCKPIHIKLKHKRRVAYGKRVTVYGLVTTSQGVPLAGAPVRILTAPANGRNHFTLAAARTTGRDGKWRATLAPGPSRIIKASYPGSARLLPAASKANVIVPARVKLKIRPTIVPWGSVIRVTGRVLGGYVPGGSNLLRLNVGIGRIGHIEGLPDIKPDGDFVILWKFNAGRGVIRPWFSVGTLSESAFPYAPGTSRRVTVTLGEPTPPRVARHKTGHRAAWRSKGAGRR